MVGHTSIPYTFRSGSINVQSGHLPSGLDPSAAEHKVTLVEDCGLAGRDGTLRLVQLDSRLAPRQWDHVCRRSGMIVPYLHQRFEALRRVSERNPVATIDKKLFTIERSIVTDHDAVIGCVKLDDIKRLGRGNSQTFSLADSIKFNSIVMSKKLSLG